MTRRIHAALVVMLIASCSGTAPPPPVERPAVVEPVAEEVPPAEEPPPSVEDDTTPEGASCESTAACEDGQHCRGPAGCEAPWACGEPRECGSATVAYCGCDAMTFYALENCPGQPYQHTGPCEELGEEIAANDVEEVEGNAICTTDADCRTGYVCSGVAGCGTFWTCVRRRSVRCGRARVPYCSCDGETFDAPERCPGRPIAHAGYCDGDEPAEVVASADGPSSSAAASEPTSSASQREPRSGPRPCMSNRDCPAGLVCEGEPGCGTEWTCVRPRRPCISDTQYFCGCGGETFRASMTCPGRPHRQRGSCPRE
jgi:hypothetical protein